MSETLERVRALVARGEVRVSLHGYEERGADNIGVRDIVEGLASAVVVETTRPMPRGHASWFWNGTTRISRFI